MAGPQDADKFDPNNPYTAIALLSMRVDNLGREKEALERDLENERAARIAAEKLIEERIAKMEKAYWKGAGILLALSAIGGVVGLLFANAKTIFAPWIRP